MTKRPLGRNEKCPCGSGKKYKHCCLKQEASLDIADDGSMDHSLPMPDDLADLLSSHLNELSEDLGRELNPDDPLFPKLQLEHGEHFMVEGMKAAGVDPAIIYAFEQTGMLVSEENQSLISEKDLAEWQAAIEAYRAKHGPSAFTYPIGTVAMYGPDDTTTTKIVASVIKSADSEPVLERFVGTGIADDEQVQAKIKAFFDQHQVTRVGAVDQNIGCPHEEGEDFPLGEDCPFCPFWEGKQGSAAAFADDGQANSAEQAMVLQMLQTMDPSIASELMNLVQQCETEEEFANMIMIGPCPECDSDNTTSCEEDPEIDNACIGYCTDCDQLWCCDCDQLFSGAAEAAAHQCPFWESLDDELDEPF